MMRAFHAISTCLLLIAVGFLIYNLMWQLVANGQFKVLSIEELWTSINKASFESAKSFAEPSVSTTGWTLFAHAPAAVILLAIAAIFYLPVRILTLLGVGKKKDWKEK